MRYSTSKTKINKRGVNKMIKIIMVDDDLLILQSLSMTLKKESDFEILITTTDANEAFELCKIQKPDIILMDIQMPLIDGIRATAKIKEKFPDIKIMMLTTFADAAHIKEAMAAGANGYLLKTDPLTELAPRLRLLFTGTGVMSNAALTQLSGTGNPLLKSLTPRELDITRLVAQGLTNKEIAGELFISEGTIRNNLVVIMEKMEVNNRLQLGISYYK